MFFRLVNEKKFKKRFFQDAREEFKMAVYAQSCKHMFHTEVAAGALSESLSESLFVSTVS